MNFRPAPVKLLKEASGRQHSDTAPGVQYQQILIPGHNGCRLGFKRQFQIPIVLGVSAVLDMFRRFNPKSRRRQQLEDLAAPIPGQDSRELWPCQNLGNFAEDRL